MVALVRFLELCLNGFMELSPRPRTRYPEATENKDFAMVKTVKGIIYGKTIELAEDLGVAEGQEVQVQVTILEPAKKWGEGILHTAGALADDPYWDAIMEEVHQARKIERRPQLEEE